MNTVGRHGFPRMLPGINAYMHSLLVKASLRMVQQQHCPGRQPKPHMPGRLHWQAVCALALRVLRHIFMHNKPPQSSCFSTQRLHNLQLQVVQQELCTASAQL